MDDLADAANFLALGQTDDTLYGNGFAGLTDDDGRAEFVFFGTGAPLILSFDAYDVDNSKELALELNGVHIGTAPRTADDSFSPVTVYLDAGAIEDGLNSLALVQAVDPGWTWGATSLTLAQAPALAVDVFETEVFGNGLSGALSPAGSVTLDIDAGVQDLTLFVQGYDIDLPREVAVVVNGQALGHLEVTDDDALGLSTFKIDASLLTGDGDTLQFVQTRSAEWTWGVTDIVLQGAGPYLLDVAVDPEFLEDYVVWQTPTAFHMARLDLNTGLIIETVATALFTPLPIGETLQGPEIMRTSDGIVGIGMTADGLVAFGETGSTLLAGTEGMILGFLPKGVTPGLRFVASDAEGNQYLYDNGTITLLDLNGGAASSWLNASEVVISYYYTDLDLLTVYDVTTGEMTKVADQAYVAIGQQASITLESGDRYIAINAGRTYDIWKDTRLGWIKIQTITSPNPDWFNIDSVELFEWNGALFLSGILTDQPGLGTYQNTIPVLYDVFQRNWTELAPVGDYMDPEVVLLNDGTIAFTYFDINRDIGAFLILAPEDVARGAAPGSVAAPGPEGRGGAAVAPMPGAAVPVPERAPPLAHAAAGPADLAAAETFVFRSDRPSKALAHLPALGPAPAALPFAFAAFGAIARGL